MTGAASNVLCLACSVFKGELEALRARGEVDFRVDYLESMLHMRPKALRRRLESALKGEREKGVKVVLLYGDCHPHMKEHESQPGVCRVQGQNCAEILLGRERYRALRAEGAFFLLPEWAMRWRQVFKHELGLEGKTAKDLMGELHTKLVYLDTGLAPVPSEQLQAASDALGLPWEVMRVGLDRLAEAVGVAADEVRGTKCEVQSAKYGVRRSKGKRWWRKPMSRAADTDPSVGGGDLAFQGMALDILAGALARAQEPEMMGSHIADQIRTLTGARTVILMRCLHEYGGEGHRVVAVDPARLRELAESSEVSRLAESCRSLEASALWLPLTGNSGPEELLVELGYGRSVASPLLAGSLRMGCLLLLDLPEGEHGVSQVLETLDLLSTVIALVLRSSSLHEEQEAIIDDRTRELADSVGALRAEITERKLAKEALEERSDELRKAVDLMAGREIRMAELKEEVRRTKDEVRKLEEEVRRTKSEGRRAKYEGRT